MKKSPLEKLSQSMFDELDKKGIGFTPEIKAAIFTSLATSLREHVVEIHSEYHLDQKIHDDAKNQKDLSEYCERAVKYQLCDEFEKSTEIEIAKELIQSRRDYKFSTTVWMFR